VAAQDKFLPARRIAQITFGLTLALALAGSILVLSRGIEIPSSVSGPWAIWPVSAGVYSFLALLIISRHSGHTVGWLFFVAGFNMALTTLGFGIWDIDSQVPSSALLRLLSFFAELIWILALLIPPTLVLQFFPNGRLPSRRWRLIPLATVLSVCGLLAGLLPDYFELTGSEGFFELLGVVTSALFAVTVIGSLAAVVVRFIRSSGTERTQMKWLVFTSAVTIGAGIGLLLLLEEEHPLISFYFTALPIVLALSIGVAILRHRLFDIDIIIRRTLQYSVVTGILAAVYFGLVVTFQALFTAIGGRQTPIFIVISTLIIAALFNPLRTRVQEIIDLRFYRSRYDAEKALAQFAAASRDEVDLDRLTAALSDVVEETMQPEKIQVWLRLVDGQDRRAISRAWEGIHENI